MSSVIKVGPNKKSYFYDKMTSKRLFGYSARNKNCVLCLNGMEIGREDISYDRAGDICIYDADNRKIIIDDGWRSILQRCGYIVFKDYDKTMITDHQRGRRLIASWLQTPLYL